MPNNFLFTSSPVTVTEIRAHKYSLMFLCGKKLGCMSSTEKQRWGITQNCQLRLFRTGVRPRRRRGQVGAATPSRGTAPGPMAWPPPVITGSVCQCSTTEKCSSCDEKPWRFLPDNLKLSNLHFLEIKHPGLYLQCHLSYQINWDLKIIQKEVKLIHFTDWEICEKLTRAQIRLQMTKIGRS